MHVVIFEVRPKPGRKGDYLDIAAALRPELAQIAGFISIERFARLTDQGKVLSMPFLLHTARVVLWGLHSERSGSKRSAPTDSSPVHLTDVSAVVHEYTATAR